MKQLTLFQPTSIFTLPKLLEAYFSCRHRKRTTTNALKFEIKLEYHLRRLRVELMQKSYRPGKSVCFVVTHPKTREIFAAEFADRVVHHLLVGEIEKYFEQIFIYHSFACRKGKGTHAAVNYLKRSLAQITQNFTKPVYYGHFDIKSFFTNIDKSILYKIVEKRVSNLSRSPQWKEEVMYLTKIIIFHDPTDSYWIKGDKRLFALLPVQKSLFGNSKNIGLPIGNLTSQFFANVYLNPLDQFAKRVLKIKYYFRYVDDIVVLSSDRQEILVWERKIQEFMQTHLALHLHPQKTVIGSVYSGIDFLGYFIKPRHTLVRRRVVKTFKNKLHYLNQESDILKPEDVFPVINSYYAHFRHANSYNLRKNLYLKHMPNLKNKLTPQNNLCSFRPRQPAV